MEKARQTKKSIKKLKLTNGEISESNEEINKEIKRFYSKLYTSTSAESDEIKRYIETTNIENKVSEIDMKSCEGQLSYEECKKALFSMKCNKAPGGDGISVELYRAFWDYLGTFLVDSLNEGYLKGELCDSQKHGIVSLIYKKEDPTLLKNWRPISLLNTDYKIAAYSLASRLKKVMPSIISTDQNGYIKNRFIGYNIRLIQDIIDYSEKFQIDSCILYLDFTKAFDTIEWNFMIEAIKNFGFGESFINWIKVLYTNITACVKNNDWLTESYSLSRGIRQGCPLSCLTFVLAVEILAIKLRSNINVKGIKINRRSVKIAQLADDTTLFLKFSDVPK